MLHNRFSKNSRGVVLVLVLVLFMALSGLTLMTIEVSSRGAVEASKVRSEYEAHFMAEEALFVVYDRIMDDQTLFSDIPREDWIKEWTDGGVTIYMSPCNAKINLNTLVQMQNPKKILTIMQRVLPGGVDVKRLVGSLGIWTGKKVNSTLDRLDRFFYASQYPSYAPTGRDLKTPEEISLVNGWSAFDRDWINETFTVWGEGRININFASRDVLLAFFPKLGKNVESIVHWRNTRGFTDLSQILTVAGIESDSELYRNMLEYMTVRSDLIEAIVVAEVSGCRVVKRYIVSKPGSFEVQQPSLIFQNDVSVTFSQDE